ncbi:phosphate transport system regulatory protein PhoU [Clostridia bacterium]|nr:phosphate transport system regulatory protein PhoU [Clostridia bacterium]
MRSRFDDQLKELNEKMIEMGALIEYAIAKTTKALIEQDAETAKMVAASDDAIDTKEREVEQLCLKLILNQQPVARDLRLISAALKMITDMERIGDQASDIAALCVYLSGQKYVRNLEHIPKMAEATIKMVTGCIDAYVRKDLSLAQSVISHDDVVDRLFFDVKTDLIKLIHENPSNGEQAFDLMQIAKYYERIGDHAVNIAEWVIFSITGSHGEA